MCWGHTRAGRQLYSLDWATSEVPGWLASDFPRLVSAGVTVMTQLCSTCLSPSSMSRPGMFSWRWQRSKGITKAYNASWGSRLRAGSTITLWPKASHQTSLGLRSREMESASLVREVLNHTTKDLILGAYELGPMMYSVYHSQETTTNASATSALQLYMVSIAATATCVGSPCFFASHLQIQGSRQVYQDSWD